MIIRLAVDEGSARLQCTHAQTYRLLAASGCSGGIIFGGMVVLKMFNVYILCIYVVLLDILRD